MLYYRAVTGSPLLPTMQWHNPDDTIRLLAENPGRHSADRGAVLTIFRLLDWSLWTSAPILALYGAALVLKGISRDLRLFDLYFPLFMIGYFFYWGDAGNSYGPRYAHPALPFMVLTILTGFRNPSPARYSAPTRRLQSPP